MTTQSEVNEFHNGLTDRITKHIQSVESRTEADCLPCSSLPAKKTITSRVVQWFVHLVWRLIGNPLPQVVIYRPLSSDRRVFTEIVCSKDVWKFVRGALLKETIDEWHPRDTGCVMRWKIIACDVSIERLVAACNRNSILVSEQPISVASIPHEEPIRRYGCGSLGMDQYDIPFRVNLRQVRSVVNSTFD